jgi:carbonic anhydrase
VAFNGSQSRQKMTRQIDILWCRLCELNVMAEVHAVREADIVRQAWRKDQPVMVHGWIYDLKEALLRDLDLN